MGIKDINKNLKEICPEAFMSIPLSRLKGSAVGIDTSLWLFKSKSTAMKEVFQTTKDPLKVLDEDELIRSIISQFYGFVYKLTQAGITPVWIFDGPTHPAKIATDKRKKARATKKVSIEEERTRLQEMSPLQRLKEIDSFIKGALGCVSYTKKEETALREEIEALGLPSFQAPFDAEIYASVMSRNRLLVGVWTTDTDTYAAGALSTITGFSGKSSKDGPVIDIVVTAIILDRLGIDRSDLRDFCILHECDFNQRIPKMGPATILKKMNEHSWNLDELMEEEPSLDWEKINLEECREIFNGPVIEGISIDDVQIDRVKWLSHVRTKPFEMDPPPPARLVDVV